MSLQKTQTSEEFIFYLIIIIQLPNSSLKNINKCRRIILLGVTLTRDIDYWNPSLQLCSLAEPMECCHRSRPNFLHVVRQQATITTRSNAWPTLTLKSLLLSSQETSCSILSRFCRDHVSSGNSRRWHIFGYWPVRDIAKDGVDNKADDAKKAV